MSEAHEDRDVDVAIVGAGLAGLCAARRLTAAGASVAVLEARDRVGGRTLNEPLGDGRVVEVGGQWIGPTQHRLAALAAALGVETFPTYTDGDELVEFRGGLRRFRGTIPPLSKLMLADVAQAQARLDRMAARVSPRAPWEADRAASWDSQTFASWLGRNVATAGGRLLLEIAIQAVWAAEPADLSLLHVLFYTRSAGRFDDLIGTDGGAQQDRFVGGSQELALRVARELGEAVVLEAPVRAIEHGGAEVVVRADGVAVRAANAIVALPPALAGRIAYFPALPALRDQLTQRMAQGSVIKCMAVYDEPFWRAEGLCGQALSDAGPVRICFDNTPHEGTPGVLLGFLEGRFARAAAQWSERERRDAVVATFTRLFGPRAAAPERYIERVWADEQWSRGCYGGFMPPGAWTAYGPALRAPVGRLRWAGAEHALTWNGYMDGAVESGEAAAEELAGTAKRAK